jgi:hypothetical protein
MIKRVEIFDRDGTLTCSGHRTLIDENGLLDLAHWYANYKPEQVAKDKLLPTADYYRQCLKDPEVYTVIITVAQLANFDIDWINNVLGKPDKLIYPVENVGKNGGQWKAKCLHRYKVLKQFAKLPKFFHEDNITYLSTVCDQLGFTGHYYPSGYGISGVKNVPA